ncbi:MAG TPA: OsmC family protein [Terriglobales bacterium]|nr:OsmC family protein [Terriglobales bacterium]
MKQHRYELRVNWTGNDGQGTRSYRAYRRDHTLSAAGKPEIPGSSDPNFRGDRSRYNPEELLVASLSACHMLWYLHLCSVNNVSVLEYHDAATGIMNEQDDGSGEFVRVCLQPTVLIRTGDDLDKAQKLHAEAHRLCFIARSVKFPVDIAPQVRETVSP